MRTYLGFDTFDDALTFRGFLINEGYEGTGISYEGNMWKVWYNKGTEDMDLVTV